MKTKDKILHTALQRFNKHGIQDVSLRDIAKQIDISVGNLNYHFPTVNDIIYGLSLQLIEDINSAMAKTMAVQSDNSLISLYKMLETIFKIQLNYKFLFNGRHAEIVTTIPKMQDYYQETFKNHFQVGSQLFGQLVKEGFLQEKILADLNGFTYMANMLSLYWQQELAIFQPKLRDKEKVNHALAISFHAYKPYLTKKGQATLIPLLKELKPYMGA